MKKLINAVLIIVAVVTLLSIAVSNIYFMVNKHKSFNQDQILIESLDRNSKSVDRLIDSQEDK